MKINNVPAYARDKAYIVYREVDGEAWYWGAWDDPMKAAIQAAEVHGGSVEASEVER